MAVVSMSKREFSRLEVLLRVQSGRLRVADACGLLDLRRRQVFRLLRDLRQDGATSLLSKHRGKPSNHRLPAAALDPAALTQCVAMMPSGGRRDRFMVGWRSRNLRLLHELKSNNQRIRLGYTIGDHQNDFVSPATIGFALSKLRECWLLQCYRQARAVLVHEQPVAAHCGPPCAGVIGVPSGPTYFPLILRKSSPTFATGPRFREFCSCAVPVSP